MGALDDDWVIRGGSFTANTLISLMRGLWESLGGLNERRARNTPTKHAVGSKDDVGRALDENRLRKGGARSSANDWGWLVPECTALGDGTIGAFVGATSGPLTGCTHMLTSRAAYYPS